LGQEKGEARGRKRLPAGILGRKVHIPTHGKVPAMGREKRGVPLDFYVPKGDFIWRRGKTVRATFWQAKPDF